LRNSSWPPTKHWGASSQKAELFSRRGRELFWDAIGLGAYAVLRSGRAPVAADVVYTRETARHREPSTDTPG
jgi:hypothetical protein